MKTIDIICIGFMFFSLSWCLGQRFDGVNKLGIEILNNQNKILTEIIELSKKYPVYEINLSKQPKQKIKKIKELEKEIQKLLKEKYNEFELCKQKS